MNKIYMGLLDDRVAIYPWEQVGSSAQNYIEQLVQALVIGQTPVVNDGYVLNNPALRDELFLKEKSFLRSLFLTGEIVIPGRRESFRELIDEQASLEIDSFKVIPPEVLSRIDDIDRAIAGAGGRIKGPDSMDVWNGFYELMNSVRGKSVAELGLKDKLVGDFDLNIAFEQFFSLEHKDKTPSRTEWEKVLDSISNRPSNRGGFSYRNFTKRSLMNLANEAYHYNFSRFLTSAHKETFGVQTALSPAFSSLLDIRKLDFDSASFELPLIQIPKPNILFSKEGVEKLLGSKNLGQARLEFVQRLNEFHAAPIVTGDLIEDLKYAANSYNKWIKDELGRPTAVAAGSSAMDFVLSMTLTGYDQINAVLSWVIGKVMNQTITGLASSQGISIDYKKQNVVAA